MSHHVTMALWFQEVYSHWSWHTVHAGTFRPDHLQSAMGPAATRTERDGVRDRCGVWQRLSAGALSTLVLRCTRGVARSGRKDLCIKWTSFEDVGWFIYCTPSCTAWKVNDLRWVSTQGFLPWMTACPLEVQESDMVTSPGASNWWPFVGALLQLRAVQGSGEKLAHARWTTMHDSRYNKG